VAGSTPLIRLLTEDKIFSKKKLASTSSFQCHIVLVSLALSLKVLACSLKSTRNTCGRLWENVHVLTVSDFV